MASDGIRRADRGEIDILAGTLARAFDDDPLTVWLFPGTEARRRKLPAFFRSLLRASFSVGEVYTGGDGRAVAIWNPPGTFPMGVGTDTRLGITTARLVGLRIATRARGLLYFQSHHPKERHWYLQMLGTNPASQGKGIGSKLLAPILEQCDASGERIYLESTKERNLPFYARHGFEVTTTMHVPGGGPTMWPMWREPR